MFYGEIPKSFVRATTTDQLPRAIYEDRAAKNKKESAPLQSSAGFSFGSLIVSMVGEIISAVLEPSSRDGGKK